jgi:uroporphyrinogen-III synthase
MRILSTKKLLPNQRQYLLSAGMSVVEADFISVSPTVFSLENVNGHLIFTSANAVNAVADHPNVQEIRRNPVFCVGEKTADLLDEVGFTILEKADYGADLAQIIVRDYATESFTLFCGNMRLDTIPDTLSANGITLNEICVYETALTPQTVAPADGILFFSPSGVESFLKENTIGDAVCFCIGTTTANAVKPHTDRIIVANKPSVENVIVQAIKFSQKTKDESQKTGHNQE